MELSEARRIIEGILFISHEPVTLKKIKDVLPEFDPSSLKNLMEGLNEDYRQHNHAFKIQEVAGGFQLVSDSQLASWIRKTLQVPRDPLVSKASLETIAIIAYRQPITKAEIEAIRGVDVSGTLDTLLERQFIRIAGRKETPGRPLLYSTTHEFLQHFGLKSINDLPPISDDAHPSLEPLVKPDSSAGVSSQVRPDVHQGEESKVIDLEKEAVLSTEVSSADEGIKDENPAGSAQPD